MFRRFICMIAVAVLATTPHAAVAVDLTPTDGGSARCVIVLPDDAPGKVRQAADDLRHYVNKMTGCALPIVKESDAPEGPAIYVGETRHAADAGLTVEQGPYPTPERCRIVTRDGNLYLLGNDAWTYDGTANAVFGLLDRLGCRWFMPGPLGEDIPRVDRLEMTELDVDETPDFIERSGVWYEYHGENSEEAIVALEQWRRRNRMGARWLPIGHNMKRIMPVHPYFDQHPEWFPAFGGKRKTEGMEGGMWHPCVSNEAFRAFVAERTAAAFRESNNVRGFSLALNDAGWQGWCQCPACKAMNETSNGDRGRGFTKRYLTFVDDVARRVKTEFPDRFVTASAYASTQAPPEDMDPLQDNVFVVVMHYYWCDQCNPFRDDPFYSDVMKGFGKLAPNRLGMYEYYGDFHYDQLPVAAWSFMDDDFDFFADNGVRMMTIEGGNHWAANLLTYYVATRKMWDRSSRTEDIVDDVCSRFFGPAAAPMRRYFDIRAKAFRAAGPNERNGRKIELDKRLDDLRALLDEAAEAVEGTRYADRVAFFRRYQGYLTIYYAAKRAVQTAKPDDAQGLAAADKAIDAYEAYLNALPEDGLVALPSAKHFTVGWMRKDMKTKRDAAKK